VVRITFGMLAEKVARNFHRVVTAALPRIFTVLGFMLFAAGCVASRFDRRRLGLAAYLALFPAAFWFGVIPLFHPNERYFMPLFPLCVAVFGRGLTAWAEAAGRHLSAVWKAPAARVRRAAAASVAAAVLVFGVLPETAKILGRSADSPDLWEDPVELKRAGAWLRGRSAGRAPVLMSLHKAVDLYAGQMDLRSGASFSADGVDRNIAYARHRGVEYVVVSSRFLPWFSNLAPLVEGRDLPPGLVPVYESIGPGDLRTRVYALRPAPGAPGPDGGGAP
jgi:hypothetical protein